MSSPTREQVVPTFTPEQMEWLRDILAPGCCYVTGLHDPTHFREGRYVCRFQEQAAYRKLRAALGMDEKPATSEASTCPSGTCPQCDYYRNKEGTDG